MKKKEVENKISEEMLQKGKKIYVAVLMLAVAVFGIGAYNVFAPKKVDNTNISTLQQDSLVQIAATVDDTNRDSDGDGIIDTKDSQWNVGPRDILLFATLAYEPAQGSYYLDNGLKGTARKWDTTKTNINYVCPDKDTNGKIIKTNPAAKPGTYSTNQNCMINQSKMVGMKANDNQTLGKMVFNSWQTVGDEYYFEGMDSNGNPEQYASIDEIKDWAIVDYTSIPAVKLLKTGGNFEATTFRYDNNFVIAYRGTDFPDLIEWMADLLGYGLANSLGDYEAEAKKYVERIIEKYTAQYEAEGDQGKEPNFYITGHSLGGYLAQIGGAYVIDPANDVKGREYLRDIIYFNGMGIGFNDGLKVSVKDSVVLGNWTEAVAAQSPIYQALLDWSKKTDNNGRQHNVTCYHNYGDPISSLGLHVNKIGFYVAPGAVRRHMKDTSLFQAISRNNVVKGVITGVLNGANQLFKNSYLSDVSKYYNYYNEMYKVNNRKVLSVADLLWFAHEPSASLLYNINQGSRGVAKEAEVVTVSHNYAKDTKKVTFTFQVNVNGTPLSYQWYKNGVAIAGATSQIYTVFENVGSQVSNNKYTVKVKVKSTENQTTTVTGVAYVDRVIPRVASMITQNYWLLKRNKTMDIILKFTDDSGFSDTELKTSDIKLGGLLKNLIIQSVTRTKTSSDGKTVEYKVVVKGNVVGIETLNIITGALVDSYGNPSPAHKTNPVKIIL